MLGYALTFFYATHIELIEMPFRPSILRSVEH